MFQDQTLVDMDKKPVLSQEVKDRIQFMLELRNAHACKNSTDVFSRNAIISSKASDESTIRECIKRLQESGDGGEKDLDKVMPQNTTVRKVKAKIGSSFVPWTRDGQPRGDAVWVLPNNPRSSLHADTIYFVPRHIMISQVFAV